MDETNQWNRGGTTLLGILLALGLVSGGWALGSQIKATRLSDRYVSVRGLAERTVKSDLAVWPLNHTEAGDDLPELYKRTEADTKTILQFLQQQGIQASEIELSAVGVTDNQINRANINKDRPYRYTLQQQITVHTSRVDQVATAVQKTGDLVQRGVVLTQSGYGQGLSYKFTGLNAIKPDMITDATRNARAAAERFAQDAGSSLGTIRQATQGVFSILPADSGVPADSDGGVDATSDDSLMKTVRVVTSVDYYLEK